MALAGGGVREGDLGLSVEGAGEGEKVGVAGLGEGLRQGEGTVAAGAPAAVGVAVADDVWRAGCGVGEVGEGEEGFEAASRAGWGFAGTAKVLARVWCDWRRS